MQHTYRLASAKPVNTPGFTTMGMHAPGIVRYLIARSEEGAHDSALQMLVEGWGVPASAANALLTKAVSYRIEDDVVVFKA